MAVEIDNLQVKISASAQDAKRSLEALTRSLSNVKKALMGVKAAAKDTSKKDGSLVSNSTEDVGKLGEKVNAIQRTSAALKTLRERFRQVGEKIKSATGGLTTFFSSLKRIAFYRLIRSALKAISEAFSEGLKSAYEFSQQNEGFSRVAETLDRIKSITSQMTNQIGAFAAELIQFLLPAIEWVVEKVRALFEYLTQLFAALNGENTYLRAKLEDLKWDDATKSLKEYKHQLLGLDELNNLSKQRESSKPKEKDNSDAYEIMPVGDNFKKVGDFVRGIITGIKQAIEELELFLIGAKVGIGAVLLFSGANIPLGLGLLIHGMWKLADHVKEDWDFVNGSVEYKVGLLMQFLGGVGAGIGAVLLFTGNVALGLGLIVGGIALWSAGKAVEDWDSTGKTTKEKIGDIVSFLGGVAAAIGVVLLFTGNIPWGLGLIIAGIALWDNAKSKKDDWDKTNKKVNDTIVALKKILAPIVGIIGAILLFTGHIPLGLGCVIAGIALFKGAKKDKDYSWKTIGKKLTKTLTSISESIITSIALGAIGAVLLFTGHPILGIGMLLSSCLLTKYQVDKFGWDGILSNLKQTWSDIVNWWNSNVKGKINSAVNWVEEKLHIDINFDGKIGGLQTTFGTVKSNLGQSRTKNITGTGNSLSKTTSDSSNKTVSDYVKEGDTWQGAAGKWVRDKVEGFIEDVAKSWGLVEDTLGDVGSVGRTFATGGIPDKGSLFYAGEQGAEFVGNMGSTSAVANTGQMTDAIYKAAYMGMSRALAENGNNGLAGFVPASTDDLFIAMRKKASNYNKMTGNSAFA